MSAYTPSFDAPYTLRPRYDARAPPQSQQAQTPPRARPLGLLALAGSDESDGDEPPSEEDEEEHGQRRHSAVGAPPASAPFVSSTLQSAAARPHGAAAPRARPAFEPTASRESPASAAAAGAGAAAAPATAATPSAPSDFVAEHAHARASRLAALNLHTHMSETLIGRVARAAAAKGGGGGNGAEPLHDLLELDLSRLGAGQKIRTIGALECVPRLERLCLSHQLVESIGTGLAPLRHLRVLQLEHNALARLDGIWHLAHCLEELHLGHNALERLPRRMAEMERLTVLRLQANKLAEIAPLTQALAPCANLTSLTLFANPLSSLPHARALLVASLPALAALDAQAVDPRERADALDRFGDAAASGGAQQLRTELRRSQSANQALTSRVAELEAQLRQSSQREALLARRADRAEHDLSRERDRVARLESELQERIHRLQGAEERLADVQREYEFWRIDHQACSGGGAGGGGGAVAAREGGRPPAVGFLSPAGSPFSPSMASPISERRNALEWQRTGAAEQTPRRLGPGFLALGGSASLDASSSPQQPRGYSTPQRSRPLLLPPTASPCDSDISAPVVLPVNPLVRQQRAELLALSLLISAGSEAVLGLQRSVLAKQGDARTLAAQHQKVRARAEEIKAALLGAGAGSGADASAGAHMSAPERTVLAEDLRAQIGSIQAELGRVESELDECEAKLRATTSPASGPSAQHDGDGGHGDDDGARAMLHAQHASLMRQRERCEQDLDEVRAVLASQHDAAEADPNANANGQNAGHDDAAPTTGEDVAAQLSLLLRKLEAAEHALHGEVGAQCARVVALNKRGLAWRARRDYVAHRVREARAEWMQRRAAIHAQGQGQGQPEPSVAQDAAGAGASTEAPSRPEWEREFEAQSAPTLEFLVHESLVPRCLDAEERVAEMPATSTTPGAGSDAPAMGGLAAPSAVSLAQLASSPSGSGDADGNGNANPNGANTSPRTPGSSGSGVGGVGGGESRVLELNELHLALSTLQLENAQLRSEAELKAMVCAELKRERKELRRELRDAQEALLLLQQQQQQQTAAAASGQHSPDALARAETRIDSLLAELSSLRAELSRAEGRASSAGQDDAELAALRSRVDDYEKDILLLNTHSAQLQRENDALADEISAARVQLRQQREEAEKQMAAAAAAAEKMIPAAASTAPQRNPEMESQLMDLQGQIAELESMLAERSAAQLAEVERLRALLDSQQLQLQQQQKQMQQQHEKQQHEKHQQEEQDRPAPIDARALEAQQMRQSQQAKTLAARQSALDAAEAAWHAGQVQREEELAKQQAKGKALATDLDALVGHLQALEARRLELDDLVRAKEEQALRVEADVSEARRRRDREQVQDQQQALQQQQQQQQQHQGREKETQRNPRQSTPAKSNKQTQVDFGSTVAASRSKPAPSPSASSGPSQPELDQVVSAAEALAALESQGEHMRATLTSLQGAIASAQSELTLRRRLAGEIHALEQQARQAAEEERSHLRALVEAEVAGLEQLRAEHARLAREVDALEKERRVQAQEQAQGRVSQQREERTPADGRGRGIEARLANEAAAIVASRGKNADQDLEAGLATQSSSDQSNAAAAAAAASAVSLAATQAELASAQAQLESLQSAAQKASRASVESEQALSAAQAQLDSLRGEAARAQSHLDKLQEAHAAERARAAEELALLREQASQVRVELRQLQAQLRDAQEHLAAKDGAKNSSTGARATAPGDPAVASAAPRTEGADEPATALALPSSHENAAAQSAGPASPSKRASAPRSGSSKKKQQSRPSPNATPARRRERECERSHQRSRSRSRSPFCPASAPGDFGSSPVPPRDEEAHARALAALAARAEQRAQAEASAESFALARAAQDQELLRAQRQVQKLALERRQLRLELDRFAAECADERARLAAALESDRRDFAAARAALARGERYVRHRLPVPLAHETPESRRLEARIEAMNALRGWGRTGTGHRMRDGDDGMEDGQDFFELQEQQEEKYGPHDSDDAEADADADARYDQSQGRGRGRDRAFRDSQAQSQSQSRSRHSERATRDVDVDVDADVDATTAEDAAEQGSATRARSRSFSPASSPQSSRLQHSGAELPQTQRRQSSSTDEAAALGEQVRSLRGQRDVLSRALSDLHGELGGAVASAQAELHPLHQQSATLRAQCALEQTQLAQVRTELSATQARWRQVQEQVARMPGLLGSSPASIRRRATKGSGTARRLEEQLKATPSPNRSNRPRTGASASETASSSTPAPKAQEQEEKEQQAPGSDQGGSRSASKRAAAAEDDGVGEDDNGEDEDEDGDAPSLSALEVSQLQQRNRELLRLHTELIAQLRHNSNVTATPRHYDLSAEFSRALGRPDDRSNSDVLASAELSPDHGGSLLLPKHCFLTLQDYHLAKETHLASLVASLRQEVAKQAQEGVALLEELGERVAGPGTGESIQARMARVEQLVRAWAAAGSSSAADQCDDGHGEKVAPPSTPVPASSVDSSFATSARPTSAPSQQQQQQQRDLAPALRTEMLGLASELRALVSSLQGSLRAFSLQLATIRSERAAAHGAWAHNVDVPLALRERDGYLLFLLQLLRGLGQAPLLRLLPPLSEVAPLPQQEEKEQQQQVQAQRRAAPRLIPGSAERGRESSPQLPPRSTAIGGGASFAQMLASARATAAPAASASAAKPSGLSASAASFASVLRTPLGESSTSPLQPQLSQSQQQPQRPSRYSGGSAAAVLPSPSPPPLHKHASASATRGSTATSPAKWALNLHRGVVGAPRDPFASPALSLRFDEAADAVEEEEGAEEEKEEFSRTHPRRVPFAEAAQDEVGSAPDAGANSIITPPLELELGQVPSLVQSRSFRTPLNPRYGGAAVPASAAAAAASPSPFFSSPAMALPARTPAARVAPASAAAAVVPRASPHSAAALFAVATGRADEESDPSGAEEAVAPREHSREELTRAPAPVAAPAEPLPDAELSPVSRSARAANESLRRGLLASRIAGLHRQSTAIAAALPSNPFQLATPAAVRS